MSRNWTIILAFAGVFVAGAVFGGFASLRYVRQQAEQARFRAPAPMEQFSPQIMKRFSKRLDLTAEQKEKLWPIIRQADGDLRRLRQTGARDAIAIAERMHEQVAQILTPGQQKKLEQMKLDMRERWQRERQKRWGERPPPGGRSAPLLPPSDSDALPPSPPIGSGGE